jgi:hypothetical protein
MSVPKPRENQFETDAEVHAPLPLRSRFAEIMRGKVAGGGILRSDTEVGFAKPAPPYVCFDRNGRWRNAHDFDERSVGEPCLFCSKPRARC